MNLNDHFLQHMEKKKRKRDGIKLFVGQIPSTMDAPTLAAFLSDYVTILDVTILRDRKTNTNKRCAFVYVESHDAANTLISSLSEKYHFPNMRLPIHIDYANTRRTSGQSVSVCEQFSTDISAFAHNHHISGQQNPSETDCLNDTLKDATPGLGNCDSDPSSMKAPSLHAQELESNSDFASSYYASAPTALPHPPGDNANLNPDAVSDSVSSSPCYLQATRNMFMISPSAQPVSISPSIYPVSASPVAPPTANGAGSTILFPPCLCTPFPLSTNPSNLPSLPISTYPSVFMLPRPSSQGIVLPVVMADRVYPVPTNPSSQRPEGEGIRMVSDVSGFHQEGPAGANVFVYHIPSTVNDESLRELFSPFGIILSTKVYVDTVTHQSRGFGFVSYSTVAEADRAIASMNGYTINGKQLKVQKKKEKHPSQHHQLNYDYAS